MTISAIPSDTWCHTLLAQQGESRFVDAAGSAIHYLVWNKNHAGEVLILVHGMMGHAHWWDVVAPYFSREYKVIAIDLSGMGDSAHRESYDIDTFANDIVSVIERESTRPVTIIGHSFGGAPTIVSCATRPELFRRAILIDSPIWMTTDDIQGIGSQRGSRIYADREAAVARFRLAPEQPVCTPALKTHIGECSLRAVPEGWRWKFDTQIDGSRVRVDPAILARLNIPMDFVCGERSGVVTAERAMHVARAIRTMRKSICIPDAYHHLMLDQPLALVSTLKVLLQFDPC